MSQVMAEEAGDDRELPLNQYQRPATTSPPNITVENAHERRDMVCIVSSVDLLKQDPSAADISRQATESWHSISTSVLSIQAFGGHP